MKISAAEAQWETCQPCSFSLFQIGGGRNDETPTQMLEVPHLLSLLATGTWNGEVEGSTSCRRADVQQYGHGNYVPNVFVQYWSMRVMAYLGSLMRCSRSGARGCCTAGSSTQSRVFLVVATWAVLAPFLMNTAGWMLTENGRQPWIVQGLMKTADGVSTSVSTTELAISIGALVAVYVLLGIVYLFLMLRYARRGLELEHADDEPDRRSPTPAITY